MTPPEPTKEHQWLQQLVGEWTMEGDADCGPDQPAMKTTGSEVVRSIGGLWIVCDGKSKIPDGAQGIMIMTLGYDSAKGKFVGSWIGSMMTNMWVYEGDLDESGKVLSLRTEGPDCEDGKIGPIGQFKDVIEMVSEDHRTLTSHAQQPDGSWKQFMRADYVRKK